MKNLYVDIELRCQCDKDLKFAQPIECETPMLAQINVTCSNCGTKYFTHIQECKPKEDTCKQNVKGV